MEALNFDRKVKCDWCGQTEICAVTHYGTSHYNRLVCLECALSINENDKILGRQTPYFDLNNSTIRFKNLVVDITKEESEEELEG